MKHHGHFLLTTLLLPALLVAPVERDIRIINIVNPFYAAAAPAFLRGFRLQSIPYLTHGSRPHHDSRQCSALHVDLEGSAHCLRRYSHVICSASWMRSRDLGPGFIFNKPIPSPGATPKKVQPSNILLSQFLPVSAAHDTVAPYLIPPFSPHHQSVASTGGCSLVSSILANMLHSKNQ